MAIKQKKNNQFNNLSKINVIARIYTQFPFHTNFFVLIICQNCIINEISLSPLYRFYENRVQKNITQKFL